MRYLEKKPTLQMLIGVGIVLIASFIIFPVKAQLGIKGVKTNALNYLTDPSRLSIHKVDALGGVDKDLAGTV